LSAGFLFFSLLAYYFQSVIAKILSFIFLAKKPLTVRQGLCILSTMKINIVRNRGSGEIGVALFIATIILLVGVACLVGCPHYKVFTERKNGEAQLAHAQASKEVAVAEAKAKLEAATMLAQAEVERAKGVAQANAIIGQSLQNNESYLRYLWITEVAGKDVDKTVVYVPTEANIPILESGRFNGSKAPAAPRAEK
jgi:hypothetical protein